MTIERSSTKPDPAKPVRRQYGPICPGCGRIIPIGAEDIAPNVDIATFREKLRREGYTVQSAVCTFRGCGHSIDAKLHLVNFGALDPTLSTRDTF
jgi:hypothetical protein